MKRALLILLLLLPFSAFGNSFTPGPGVGGPTHTGGSGGGGDGVGISSVTDDDGPAQTGAEITFTDTATAAWTCAADACAVDVVGGGDVTGPVSSTANAIVVWSGTGGDTLLDSAATIVSGDLTTAGSVEASELIVTPHATAGGELCLTDGVDDGETPWCIKMADAGIDSGTCTRTGATWSGDCPGGSASVYSVAGASISGVNVDNYTTPLNIASELGSAVGSHVVVDVSNDHIELLTAGTYKITFKILAGFVISTTECMAFEVYNKTGATTIPMQQSSFQGTGDHASAEPRRGTSIDGVAWITIATPTDVEIYAKGCAGGTFPTTNTIGSASSSLWVERVK